MTKLIAIGLTASGASISVAREDQGFRYDGTGGTVWLNIEERQTVWKDETLVSDTGFFTYNDSFVVEGYNTTGDGFRVQDAYQGTYVEGEWTYDLYNDIGWRYTMC